MDDGRMIGPPPSLREAVVWLLLLVELGGKSGHSPELLVRACDSPLVLLPLLHRTLWQQGGGGGGVVRRGQDFT